jgi:hypothetical protein
MVRGGWLAAVVWIQCLNFSLRGDAMGRNIVRRRSGGSELVLALWEGSVTRRGGVMTLTGGEAVPGTGKGGDDVN